MIKKRFVITLVFGLLVLQLFSLGMLKAQEENPDVAFGLNAEQIESTTTKVTTSWEYLSKEWKTILLKNSFVKGADSVFIKISMVFFVLFAEPYSMSLKLLLIILLWIYCLVFLYNAFKNFSMFSKGPSFVISFGLVMGMAHMKIIEAPVNGLIWLFFGEKELWVKLVAGVVIFFVLVLLFVLGKKYGKQFKEKRKKMKDEMNRMKVEQAAKVGEAFTGTLLKK